MKNTRTSVGKDAKHGLGPDSWWTVDVDVYLENENNPPDFTVETCLPTTGNDIAFHNRGRNGFKVAFHLHDLTGNGYCFPGPPQGEDKALASTIGEGCPPKNSTEQWEEFKAIKVKDSRMTLVVRNLNQSVTKFGYTLRVTKDDGATFLELDPGGDNQNGNFAADWF